MPLCSARSIALHRKRCDITRFTITNVHLFTPEHTFGPLTSIGVENGVLTGDTGGETVDGQAG